MLYYRAHHMSGNTAFVDALCGAVEDAGGRALPLYVASLRAPEAELLDALGAVDAIVTTVLAAGGTRPADASAGGDEEAWDAGALASLGRTDPAGAVPDRLAQRVGGERRGRCHRLTRPVRSPYPSSTAG